MSSIKLSIIVLVTAVISAGISAGAIWLFVDEINSDELYTGMPPVNDFALLDHSGQFHRLYKYNDTKAIVLYSYDAGCTMISDELRVLHQLKEKYAAEGVEILLIKANLEEVEKNFQLAQPQADIGFPVLSDISQLVSAELGLIRSGDVVLIDTSTWGIRYRGPVDNRGPQQPQGSDVDYYLKDAIEAVLDNQQLTVPVVSGDGCLIKFADPLYRPSISYEDNIAPILKEKCITCHRPGGVGPWVMDRYQTVKDWSARIKEVVMTQQMPPWHADPSIGHFSPDRSLTIPELRNLIQWINSGAPRGDGGDPLVQTPPASVEKWPLGKPDLVIDLPNQKLPAQGEIPYRWVKVKVPLKKDTWVRAVELQPSNPAVMHHGFVFVKFPKRLEKSEPLWMEGRNGFFVAYVPGVNVLPLPENSGQLLPAGGTLIFQLHYVTTGSLTEDNPKLALYFHESPPAMEYKTVSASNMKIRIPPYAGDHPEKAETVMTENGQLHGFYPHMHYRGKNFLYEAIYPDGRSEKLLSVPNYDIHWQTFYRLSQPKLLPVGTRILVEAAFDNSANNPVNPDPSQEIKWGLKSSDEMLVGYFMYTRDRNSNNYSIQP